MQYLTKDGATAYHYIFTIYWLNFFHGKSLSRGHLPTIFPKIQNHDKCLLHIQDATGKKKLAPDRSGNVMVSPENSIVFTLIKKQAP